MNTNQLCRNCRYFRKKSTTDTEGIKYHASVCMKFNKNTKGGWLGCQSWNGQDNKEY